MSKEREIAPKKNVLTRFTDLFKKKRVEPKETMVLPQEQGITPSTAGRITPEIEASSQKEEEITLPNGETIIVKNAMRLAEVMRKYIENYKTGKKLSYKDFEEMTMRQLNGINTQLRQILIVTEWEIPPAKKKRMIDGETQSDYELKKKEKTVTLDVPSDFHRELKKKHAQKNPGENAPKEERGSIHDFKIDITAILLYRLGDKSMQLLNPNAPEFIKSLLNEHELTLADLPRKIATKEKAIEFITGTVQATITDVEKKPETLLPTREKLILEFYTALSGKKDNINNVLDKIRAHFGSGEPQVTSSPAPKSPKD